MLKACFIFSDLTSHWCGTLMGGFHFMILARTYAFKSYNIFLHREVGFTSLGPRYFFMYCSKISAMLVATTVLRCMFWEDPNKLECADASALQKRLGSIGACRPAIARRLRELCESSLQALLLPDRFNTGGSGMNLSSRSSTTKIQTRLKA